MLEYAEHLLAREQREECLAVVDQALEGADREAAGVG